jgi:DNA-binding HxlR family transcriptional regulator
MDEPAPRERTYGDLCGIARALDVVGERWALLVVRELLLGPKRFTDLRDGLPGASANILSQRLRELEAAGVVARRTLPPPAASRVYELTERGRELEPVLDALGRWGSRCVPRDPAADTSIDARILALKTLFDPALASGLSLRIELILGTTRFALVVDDGSIAVTRGGLTDRDACLRIAPDLLPALLWNGLPLADAVATGSAEVAGDAARAQRFLGLFPLAPPVAVTA